MRVGILLFDDVEELDFVGPLEVFGVASGMVRSLSVLTVSKNGRPIQGRYGLRIQPNYAIGNCPPLDLLIVPGGKGARVNARYDKEIIDFVKAHSLKQEIASVCTGAIVLAEAGILNGKRATTHHSAFDMLRQYSDVRVIEGERFVLEDGVATSAGISAGIDLSLELVRRHFGDKVAREVASEMEYPYHPTQSTSSKL
jgi:transcriptional regulator GlxA family with amidase domain